MNLLGSPSPASRWRLRTGAALLTGGLAAMSTARAEPIVQQPRSYGYVLGDVLTQRVELDDGQGHTEVPVMPSVARANAWFDRLPAHVEQDRDGHTWLRIDYQVVNAHRDLELANLPALTVQMKSGHAVSIPEWSLSIGPLTPDVVFGKGDLQSMQPDHPAAPHSTLRVQQRFRLWAALFGVTLLGWLGWYVWRGARDASRLPFARAARDVRQLRHGSAAEDSAAWIALHRAFNDAAGRTVHATSLKPLFERAPYLAPLRAEIEVFFAASSQRFFARRAVGPSLRLDDLCRRLKHAEKRGSGGRGA